MTVLFPTPARPSGRAPGRRGAGSPELGFRSTCTWSRIFERSGGRSPQNELEPAIAGGGV